MRCLDAPPVDYIEGLLRRSAHLLGLPWHVIRSSTLAIPAHITGQDRILAIAAAIGARRHVNPPGGRALYDPARFTAAGVELCFLPEHQDNSASILARLLQEPQDTLAAESKPTRG